MSTEGNKSKLAYEEAQKQYLEAGKRYSGLLRDAMELDPNIIKIAEEILVTGDKISVHDNKLLTRFYNELHAGSKIDKKYYDLLIGLKKAKNELDIATDHLLTRRVGKILAGVGIPPRESNYSKTARISHLNDPDISFLTKISLPGVLLPARAAELEQLIAGAEISVASGKFLPKTKTARDFLKKLEKDIRQDANDGHLLDPEADILDKLAAGGRTSLMDLLKASGEKDHLRELERRIDAGDIHFVNGELRAINEKGTKYLRLLSEELTTLFNTKIDGRLASINQTYIDNDPRLAKARRAVDSLRETSRRHARLAGIANGTIYGDLLTRVDKRHTIVESKLSQLLTEVETISRAFLDIKKRLISVSSKEEVDVESLISLLVASRHLSKFESDYERDLSAFEDLLGVHTENSVLAFGPASASKLAETCCGCNCRHLDMADVSVRGLVADRIRNRKPLGEQMDKVITDFVLSSDGVTAYKDLLCSQDAIREHISDVSYAGGSLYQGIGSLSYLIEELVELEVEKREKIADFINEFELAHKELWLAGIKNANKGFIADNFPDLNNDIKGRAVDSNSQLVASAREEIKSVIEKFRNDHKASSENFGKQLKESLNELKVNGDVVNTSARLKTEYKKMLASHSRALDELEIEIGVLERKLSEFEVGSKKDLEKVLLEDIRKNI